MTLVKVRGPDIPKRGDRTLEPNGMNPGSLTRRRQPETGEAREPEEGRQHPVPREGETEAQLWTRIQRETTRDEQWDTPYGDKRHMNDKEEDHLVRIVTYNVGSFPKIGSAKQDILKQTVKTSQIIGMSELNTNWTKTSAQESLKHRTDRWYTNPKTQVAWLCDPDWPSQYQQGGVSLTIQGHLSPFVQAKGADTDGMGRWAWYTLEGRSPIKTAVLQIYRPCRNRQDLGSTYMQQMAWADTEPLDKFDKDLLKVIDSLRNEGHQIIIMGDLNQPLDENPRGLEQQLLERGIIDHVRQRYGKETAPNTHYRGSKPIDAILASDTLEMIRGGYDAGQSSLSDHRSIWAEFTMTSMLGEDRGVFEKPKTRKLQIKNKRVTKRFNKTLESQLESHDMVARAERLWDSIGEDNVLTEEQQQTYESLDRQRGRATSHANKKCAKRPSDDADFSPEYRQALGQATIWAEILRRVQTRGYVHTRWLARARERWGIQDKINVPTQTEQVKEKLRQAKTELKEIKSKAPELREDFLDMLVRQAEDEGNEKRAKDIRAIRDQERARQAHARIKAAQGKLRGGGVKFVERLNPDGTRTTIKDKDEMEQEILMANETKLHAADESPLRQGELGELITDGDYQKWEQFLNGELTLPDNLEEGTRRWLQIILDTPASDEKIEITPESYTRSWMKPREHTACAPGPMHFGTFKAMKWSDPAARLHTIMAAIPIRTGYTPERWNQCTDSMLPKKADEWRPSKLRLTALLTPDYNHNNKLLGREAMKMAEKKKLLAPEQYGSRKNLSAAKHALNKRLVLDILRLQKRPGIICANDAKACYDRILHFAAYVSLRRAGLTKEATTSMIRPITRLSHRIRTAYGDSKITYGGDEWTRDPSGICQGNGAGPAIWALVSSPLLTMVREAGFGAKLHAAIGDTFLHLAGFAFVDDADTIQTGEPNQDIDSLMETAQQQLTLWEQGIRATGGGIDPTKSDFAVVNFQWNDGKWTYATKNDAHTLSLNTPQEGQRNLTQMGHDEARRTLGVWQAPDGNEEKQTEKMKEKAQKWSTNIRKGFLSREEIAFGVTTSLYPSITFGMMATALTEEQAKDVFKPIRAQALGPMGYNRTMAAVVVHGPKKYGGLGIRDLYSIQGIEHIKILLEEMEGSSPTTSLLKIQHQDHVLEIGRRGFLYGWKYNEVAHLMTDTWVKNTLQFISDSEITVEGDHPELTPWRERDSMLMDDFAEAIGHRITKHDLVKANRCRLYLQATTRSDIASGNGSRILPSAWRVERDWISSSAAAYRWPYQPRPGQDDIKAWTKVLHATYGVDAAHLGWARQLGPVLKEAQRYTKWRYERQEEHLYQKTDRGWRRWTKMIQRARSAGYTPTDDYEEDVGENTHPAVVTVPPRREIAYLEGHDRHTTLENHDTQEAVPRATSLTQALLQLDEGLQWALEECEFPDDDGVEIATRLRRGTLEVTCDGSLKDKLGTAAGTTKDIADDKGYRFWNRVPGASEDQTSYRSELCGILGHVLFLNAVADYHNLDTGHVTLGCDNEAALWEALGKDHTTAGSPSFDLLNVIHHHIQQGKIQWTRRHVYGHQDRKIPRDELDPWALSNIDVDLMAEHHWNRSYANSRRRPKPSRMTGEGWRISIQGNPVASNIAERIYDHRYFKRCAKYWKTKGRIIEGAEHEIDWDLYAETIRITPRSKAQWTTKHFSGFEGTNYMLHKFGDRNSPTCPMCPEIERHTHIIQCQAPQAATTYKKLENNLANWLHDTTSPGLTSAIIEIMDAHRNKRPIHIQELWPDEVREAVTTQSTLGERAFIEGCLHKHWESIQAQYLEQTQSRRSPRRWMRLLIQKIWMVSWDMWDARNGVVHDNPETQQQQIVAALEAEITDIHNHGTRHQFLPQTAKDFFAVPLEDIIAKSDYQKRVWRRLGNRYLENDDKRMQRNQAAATMREWLVPGSTRGRRRVRHRMQPPDQRAAREPQENQDDENRE